MFKRRISPLNEFVKDKLHCIGYSFDSVICIYELTFTYNAEEPTIIAHKKILSMLKSKYANWFSSVKSINARKTKFDVRKNEIYFAILDDGNNLVPSYENEISVGKILV